MVSKSRLENTLKDVPIYPPDYTVEEQPSEMLLIQELESGRPKPLVFVLNANLLAMVKLVNCEYLSPLTFHCAL